MRRRFAAALAVVALGLAACERAPTVDRGAETARAVERGMSATSAASGDPTGGSAAIDAEAAALLDLDAPALAAELAAGRVTAERVTRAVLARIAALDDAGPTLNAIIETNPDAIAIARELDARFAASGPVGPLHGVPVVLKANIATADAMATSAGSLALAEHRAAADAEIVARLRAAGAVVVGKTNMSEWANFRSLRSTSGWSSVGGQTVNPYVLNRNPCGSSSGSAVAVAARLVPLAVGTETNGSIVCPAGVNGIVGIKPTHGAVSRDGIVPLAASFDTAGPMARTVAGAALLLSVIVTPNAQAAERDAASAFSMRGARIGVIRDYSGAGDDRRLDAAFTAALRLLADGGATLVDPIDVELTRAVAVASFDVMLLEFKDDVDAFLSARPASPRSLAELVAYNEAHGDAVMPHFEQEILERALDRDGRRDPRYAAALAESRDAVRTRLTSLLEQHELDALIAPVNAPAWRTEYARGDTFSVSSSTLAAVSGFPSIAVPSGFVGELPVAVAFIGRPRDEPRLIALAAAFEAARGVLAPPRFLASAGIP